MDHRQDIIVQDLRELLLELRQRHDIRAAFLFGSHARGSVTKYSDIDVAIILGSFRNGSPFDERFEIFHEVQERNSLIEVVCFTEVEFDQGEGTLVRYIKREGVRIV